MNKKECEKAVEEICELCKEKHEVLYGYKGLACAFRAFDNTDCDKVRVFKQLIKEHFDPQPYKFEELHEGMWVWDDVEKKCNKIININTVKLLLPTSNSDKKIGFYYITENPLRYIVEFEENRFFPVTKAKGE